MVPLALVFLAPLAAADSFNLSETLTSHMILQQAPARAVSPLLHAVLGGGRGGWGAGGETVSDAGRPGRGGGLAPHH